MFKPGPSLVEMGVQRLLYWPDGSRKVASKSHPMDIFRDWTHQLAQALVDKYNDDHNLVGDFAYQLKEVMRCQAICEGDVLSLYYHINFTAMAHGVDHGVAKLFFAELTSIKGEHEQLVPNCLLMLQPTDSGTCHGCQNNGSGEHMKHPNQVFLFAYSHVKDAFLPYGAPKSP
uniref:DUF3615 domain-containing protein n=1 Tax=Triticum urartu TaxID=4572 RepID=A0A8R7PMW0_TRIUA